MLEENNLEMLKRKQFLNFFKNRIYWWKIEIKKVEVLIYSQWENHLGDLDGARQVWGQSVAVSFNEQSEKNFESDPGISSQKAPS